MKVVSDLLILSFPDAGAPAESDPSLWSEDDISASLVPEQPGTTRNHGTRNMEHGTWSSRRPPGQNRSTLTPGAATWPGPPLVLLVPLHCNSH